jgi:hypothetical protein
MLICFEWKILHKKLNKTYLSRASWKQCIENFIHIKLISYISPSTLCYIINDIDLTLHFFRGVASLVQALIYLFEYDMPCLFSLWATTKQIRHQCFSQKKSASTTSQTNTPKIWNLCGSPNFHGIKRNYGCDCVCLHGLLLLYDCFWVLTGGFFGDAAWDSRRVEDSRLLHDADVSIVHSF